MGSRLSVRMLDGRMSMTWVTCAARVAVASSLVVGGSGLLLGCVDWIYWAVNTDEL